MFPSSTARRSGVGQYHVARLVTEEDLAVGEVEILAKRVAVIGFGTQNGITKRLGGTGVWAD